MVRRPVVLSSMRSKHTGHVGNSWRSGRCWSCLRVSCNESGSDFLSITMASSMGASSKKTTWHISGYIFFFPLDHMRRGIIIIIMDVHENTYLGYIELLAIVLLFKVLCLLWCIKLENNGVLVWRMIPSIRSLWEKMATMEHCGMYYLITRYSQWVSRIKWKRSSSCINDGTARIHA